MKTYLEIAVDADSALRESLIPAMLELGCHGFQETETSLFCYFDESGWRGENKESHLAELRSILTSISSNASFRFRELPEENWNLQWEESIQPVDAGDRFIIAPTWKEAVPSGSRTVLRIDPKMSFGTGHHETTRLMVRLLERYLPASAFVLDVGTGTGILAIAAVKLGASGAEAIDIDHWSIENAQENCAANGVQHLVTVSGNTTGDYASHSFDLIASNLTLLTNRDLLPEFSRLLKPGGILLLSGFMDSDGETMREAVSAAALLFVDALTDNGWLALAARQPAPTGSAPRGVS